MRQSDLIEELFSSRSFLLIVLDACRYDFYSEIRKEYSFLDVGNLWQTRDYVVLGRGGRPDPMSDIDTELLVNAYRDNLRYVVGNGVRYVLELSSRFKLGRVVITGDHGESLWEYRPEPPHYDPHPRGVDWPWLRRVPWHEIQ